MGHADTGRILINDVSNKGKIKAHAISLERDLGLNNTDWEKVGLENGT